MARSRKGAAASLDTNAEDLVRVYPHPDLAHRPDRPFLPGVGSDGADVAPELAAEWLAAGLATTEAPADPASED